MTGRTTVIVGNGDVASDRAAMIDGADRVVRFNFLRTYGGFAGTRTDVVAVCNTGRPAKAMLESTDWRAHPAVTEATALWCARDPKKFAAMRPGILADHPDLDDFCDDYTGGFRAFADETGKAFRSIPETVHEALDGALKDLGGRYVAPSTGIVAIADVLASAVPGERVLIAGFGHEGWEHHPFPAERRLVERYVAEGRVERL